MATPDENDEGSVDTDETTLFDNEQYTLADKPNTTSVAWKYFGLKADLKGRLLANARDSPVCKVCHKPVPAKGGNTTNLLVHLRDHHPQIYSEV